LSTKIDPMILGSCKSLYRSIDLIEINAYLKEELKELEGT